MLECPLVVRLVPGSIPHGGPIELFLDPFTTGVTKAVVSAILFVGRCI